MSRVLRDRPQGQSNALEPYYPLLESAGRSVDRQANRRARSGPGTTINQGRMNGSPGVTSFLKVTGGGKTLEKFLSALDADLAEHYRMDREHSGTTGKGHNYPVPKGIQKVDKQ